MTLLNPAYKAEFDNRLSYFTAFLASHSDDYTEDGRLDVDALAEALAENFGILLSWALELAEQYILSAGEGFRAGKEGAK